MNASTDHDPEDAGSPPAAEIQPTQQLHDTGPGIPRSITLLGFGIAVGLIAVGILVPVVLSQSLTILQKDIFLLSICIGFAIILALLGTRSGLQWRGLFITGAGVIAIVLYILLNPSLPCRLGIWGKECWVEPESLVTGRLSGDFDAEHLHGFDMRTRAGPPIMGAMDIVNGQITGFLFEIREKSLEERFDACIRVSVYEDREYPIFVPISFVRDSLHALSPPLNWEYSQADGAIYSHAGGKKLPIGSRSCASATPTDSALLPYSGSLHSKVELGLLEDLLGTPAWAGGGLDDILKMLRQPTSPIQKSLSIESFVNTGRESPQSAQQALSLAIGFLNAAPQEVDRRREFLQIMDGLLNDPEALTSFNALGNEDKTIVAKLIQDPSEEVSSLATLLVSSYADASWLSPILDGFSLAGDSQRRDRTEIVLSAIYARSSDPEKAKFRAVVLADPTSPVSGAFVRDSTVRPNTIGWSFYGVRAGNEWSERYYTVAGNAPNAIPKIGDTVVPTGNVNVRQGVIEYTPGVGWVNKPVLKVATPSDKYGVTDVTEVVPGFVWIGVQTGGP